MIRTDGMGTETRVLKSVASKQVPPACDKLMVYHLLSSLMMSDVCKILSILPSCDHFMFEYPLGAGSRFWMSLHYGGRLVANDPVQTVVIYERRDVCQPCAPVLCENLSYKRRSKKCLGAVVRYIEGEEPTVADSDHADDLDHFGALQPAQERDATFMEDLSSYAELSSGRFEFVKEYLPSRRSVMWGIEASEIMIADRLCSHRRYRAFQQVRGFKRQQNRFPEGAKLSYHRKRLYCDSLSGAGRYRISEGGIGTRLESGYAREDIYCPDDESGPGRERLEGSKRRERTANSAPY